MEESDVYVQNFKALSRQMNVIFLRPHTVISWVFEVQQGGFSLKEQSITLPIDEGMANYILGNII